MRFLITWFLSKLKLFNLELPEILKMIKTITVITSIQSVWVTRPSRSDLGAIRACLGPVCRAWHKFCSFKASMRQYKYELICFRTTFCFANFSAPFNRTKMVLYSKCVYGSQFSGEENNLKIRSLVAEISIKNPVSFFLGHPVWFEAWKTAKNF